MEKSTKNGIVGVTEIARNWILSSLSRKQKTSNYDLDVSSSPQQQTIEIENDTEEKQNNRSQQKCRRNLLKRIKIKMEIKLPCTLKGFNTWRNNCITNSDINISKQQQQQHEQCVNTTKQQRYLESDYETKPLTDRYRKYMLKKWLKEDSSEHNNVMYKACSEMLSHVWYWGEISRHDAQKQLTGKPNGSFLVRDSETHESQFTLSFRIGNYTLHYRLQYRDNYWHFEELVYESIVEMIEDIMTRSTDEKFVCYVKAPSEMQPPFPVILKYPISRYSKIPQLQELCRHTIQEYINSKEIIEKLPIPIKLQQYLFEKSSLIF